MTSTYVTTYVTFSLLLDHQINRYYNVNNIDRLVRSRRHRKTAQLSKNLCIKQKQQNVTIDQNFIVRDPRTKLKLPDEGRGPR